MTNLCPIEHDTERQEYRNRALNLFINAVQKINQSFGRNQNTNFTRF